ncbi:MAG: type II 3-dehydroquinate dehydratase [Spirochaetia bacterium]|nr:type II 3-dehydroquinate dehydratase [Spirochaetia bacterium]
MQDKATEEGVKIKVLVLQGPNINLLGEREPGQYGLETLEVVHLRLQEKGEELGLELEFFQSNHEGALIDKIHDIRMDSFRGIIINPGGLTHTSVSLRDALAAVSLPFIEVHISNVFAREEFRHHSYLSPIASGIIAGTGVYGYTLALYAIKEAIRRSR